MSIELKPDYYCKTTNTNGVDNVDTTTRYLLYHFTLQETYLMDTIYSKVNDPQTQLELLDKITRDLGRSIEKIEELKEKVKSSIKDSSAKSSEIEK